MYNMSQTLTKTPNVTNAYTCLTKRVFILL